MGKGVGIFGYNDKEGIKRAIDLYLSSLKDGDYLVIIREGDTYLIQNSTFFKSFKEITKYGKSKGEEMDIGKWKIENIKILRLNTER